MLLGLSWTSPDVEPLGASFAAHSTFVRQGFSRIDRPIQFDCVRLMAPMDDEFYDGCVRCRRGSLSVVGSAHASDGCPCLAPSDRFVAVPFHHTSPSLLSRRNSHPGIHGPRSSHRTFLAIHRLDRAFSSFQRLGSSLSTCRVRPSRTLGVVSSIGLGQLHVWIDRRARARLDTRADRKRSHHGHRNAVRSAGHAQRRTQLLRRDQRSRPEEHRSLQRSGTDHQDLHGTSWCDERRHAEQTNERRSERIEQGHTS